MQGSACASAMLAAGQGLSYTVGLALSAEQSHHVQSLLVEPCMGPVSHGRFPSVVSC